MRQVLPLRGDARSCRRHHGGDWHTVNAMALQVLGRARTRTVEGGRAGRARRVRAVRRQGENEAMVMCRKCGAQKRRWPRSCSRCHSRSDRGDAAADTAELAVETGLLGWVGRGVMSVVRLISRAVD